MNLSCGHHDYGHRSVLHKEDRPYCPYCDAVVEFVAEPEEAGMTRAVSGSECADKVMAGQVSSDRIVDLERRVEALDAINRGRWVALEILAAREPLGWYLSQLGDA